MTARQGAESITGAVGTSGANGTSETARAKRWAPKVKTGCFTCRVRRVKCDEGKPWCRRCRSTGRDCRGYATTPISQLTSRQPLLPLIRQPSDALSALSRLPSQREMHTFNLLRSEVVEQVAGSFDQSFWTTDVLRAAQAYPAIWHASLAMTAMHNRGLVQEETEQDVKRQYYVFALAQYNESIKHLIAITRQVRAERPTIVQQETLLLANLLFLGICCLQKDMTTAVSHGQNILRFYYQWEFWSNEKRTDCLLAPSSLIALITNVEAQFANRLDYMSRPECEHEAPPACSAAPYSSVKDCYFELQPLVTRFLHAYRQFGTPDNAVRCNPNIHAAYREEFRVWKAKFSLFKAGRTLRQDEKEGLLILTIMCIGMKLCLNMDASASMLQWDKYNHLFDRMITLAEELHAYINTKKQQSSSCFSFSLSLCEAFWFAGNNCRDYRIRRRAIALAEKWPLWDGIWDPKLIALICKATMNLEEEPWLEAEAMKCDCRSRSFICEDHRVAVMHTRFVGPGDTRISMKTLKDVKENRGAREVRIPW